VGGRHPPHHQQQRGGRRADEQDASDQDLQRMVADLKAAVGGGKTAGGADAPAAAAK
jgi:hypothetical protein